ncbi:hypothetical protein [Methanoculleus sp.]|uniref:hypothetical protein n=1 Tax=Methanoculleus sp. TaxID=90427 RepID=UPI002FC6EE77
MVEETTEIDGEPSGSGQSYPESIAILCARTSAAFTANSASAAELALRVEEKQGEEFHPDF